LRRSLCSANEFGNGCARHQHTGFSHGDKLLVDGHGFHRAARNDINGQPETPESFMNTFCIRSVAALAMLVITHELMSWGAAG